MLKFFRIAAVGLLAFAACNAKQEKQTPQLPKTIFFPDEDMPTDSLPSFTDSVLGTTTPQKPLPNTTHFNGATFRKADSSDMYIRQP